MKYFKKAIKSILPSSVWESISSVYSKRRLSIAPRVEEFTDPVATQNAIGTLDSDWKRRIRDVKSCPDNLAIPRCEHAGSLVKGLLTMHNGIKVGGFSYYGAGIMNLLIQNKGVHEPQEERAFQDTLPWIAPGGTMLELGAYWGFYSLWFAGSVADSKNYLVEPMEDNLEAGKVNFRLNEKEAVFERAFVGSSDKPGSNGPPTITVDSFLSRHGIERLAILHSDVQGAELDMLRGALGAIESRSIDFCFVSTHSNELHKDCVDFLKKHQYKILVNANLDESYAEDGVIVATSPIAKGPESLQISRKH